MINLKVLTNSNRARIGLRGSFALMPALAIPFVALARLPGREPRASQAFSIVPADTAPVPAAYFGLHVHRAVALQRDEHASLWPSAPNWSWRLWDARVAWKDIEPRRGTFDFARLDALCARARASHVRVLLTLGATPGWASARPLEASNYEPGNQAPPADIEDWRRYVDTLARRYRGQIEAYEIWNEPNLKGFYSGTPRELVELSRVAYASVKAVDPSARIVTPSATGLGSGSKWLKAFLAAGGDAYADVVGFHFYVTPGDPELMLGAIDSVRAVLAGTRLGKAPIWNTESGWLLQNHDVRVLPAGPVGTFGSRVLDDSTGAAFVGRALIVGRCGSLSRFYWYAWDNRRMGFLDADGQTRKPEANAYEVARGWLLGARVVGCNATSDGIWTVHISRGRSDKAIIVWSTGRESRFPLPTGWKVISQQPLLGNAVKPQRIGRSPLIVTKIPTLLTYQAASR